MKIVISICRVVPGRQTSHKTRSSSMVASNGKGWGINETRKSENYV